MKNRLFKVLSVPVMLVAIIPYIILGHIWWIIRGDKSPIEHIEEYFDWLDGSTTK